MASEGFEPPVFTPWVAALQAAAVASVPTRLFLASQYQKSPSFTQPTIALLLRP